VLRAFYLVSAQSDIRESETMSRQNGRGIAGGAAAAVAPVLERPGPEPRIRVLVLNPFDEDLIRLFEIFSHTNWTVYWLTHGADAAAMLREKAGISVVMCERELPDGTWREVLAQVDGMPDPPVVVVTSRLADDRLWGEVLNLGGYDVLMKPFEAEEVFRVVSLASRCVRSSRVRPADLPPLRKDL
jgi:DNA-binding response OmpR family regulator